jgi:hypothetical protein
MPLTDSESRYQRKISLSKAKSTSTNIIDESVSLGTAVNPRERPRGMAPSASLINFNQTIQKIPAAIVPPPPSSRSGSAAQLMFDDDFSQIPSHAISLTNLPTGAITEGTVSRARPSPPVTVSAASGLALQKQFLPPPPSSTVHAHQRSASQTVSPTNTQSSFYNASSVDLSMKQQVVSISEISDDDNELRPNLNKFKIHNYSTENVKSRESLILNEDNQLLTEINSQSDEEHTSSSNSDDENNNKFISRSKTHHPPTEEAKKNYLSPDANNDFDQLINEDSDDEETSISSSE